MRVILGSDELRVGFKHEEFPGEWIHHRTTCSIWEISDPGKPLDQQELIARGEAECCALDNFKKETGRKIALARAIEQLSLPKEERTSIWSQYHQRAADGNKKTLDTAPEAR